MRLTGRPGLVGSAPGHWLFTLVPSLMDSGLAASGHMKAQEASRKEESRRSELEVNVEATGPGRLRGV